MRDDTEQSRPSQTPEIARIARVIESAEPPLVEDPDPFISKAMSLMAQLDQTAKGHGYQSFWEMQRRLGENREELDKEGRYQLLKRIAPALHEAEEYTAKRVLPGADATGLLAIQDLVRSVARLIRVLLVGYTPEEREELADRIRAERAVDVDSAMAQSAAETNHQPALYRVAATAQASSLAARWSSKLLNR